MNYNEECGPFSITINDLGDGDTTTRRADTIGKAIGYAVKDHSHPRKLFCLAEAITEFIECVGAHDDTFLKGKYVDPLYDAAKALVTAWEGHDRKYGI